MNREFVVWVLKQDFEKSPCPGATVWLEGERECVDIDD